MAAGETTVSPTGGESPKRSFILSLTSGSVR